MLRTFITYLIVGPDVKCRNSMSKNRKIDSIYQNFVFATRTGKKETRTKFCKQEWLSKVLLTGSKKAVEDIVSVTMSLKKLKQNIYMLLLKKMY